MSRTFAVAWSVLTLSALAQAQGPRVRIQSDRVRPVRAPELGPARAEVVAAAPLGVCDALEVAHQGQAVPGGGTLASVAHFNAVTRTGAGGSAFYSPIGGSPRNQGIFVADAQGLLPIAVGCGGGGGSGNPGSGVGDPTPLGGTFSGLFGGTAFAPGGNRNGDVLFLADVDGGSSPRGLFLYTSAAQAIVAVAAIGDPSPAGGAIAALGPGSLNDDQVVVFLARGSAAPIDQILRWEGGVLSVVAAEGDSAPGGGAYAILGSESFGFPDGTSIPTGPLPDIDAKDRVSFRPITAQGERGIVVVEDGVHSWYVQAGDPTPHGGTYLDMQAAVLNDAGEIAFFADWKPTPSTFNSGWFVGKPGDWRAALSFFDPVSTGQCFGLAFSRNPMQPLDEAGNLLQWIVIDYGGGLQREALVVSAADGALTIAAEQGDPAPAGGSYGSFDAWPSLTGLRGAFGAATPGGPALNAYFQLEACIPPPTTYCTAGTSASGCQAAIGATGTASATAASGFSLLASGAEGQKDGLFFYGTNGRQANSWGNGTSFQCVVPPAHRASLLQSGGTGGACDGSFAEDLNARWCPTCPKPHHNPGAGALVQAQLWHRDPQSTSNQKTTLSDAIEFWVAP
jgi:hypothetical protein